MGRILTGGEMSFCCKCKAGMCKTVDCDSVCDCHPPEYPNDKEKQEWMNAPLGTPDVERCKDCHWPLAKSVEEGCVSGNCSMRPVPKRHAEDSIKFWSDKYDAKVDELHEMWKEARSFESDFNSAHDKWRKAEDSLDLASKSIVNQMAIIDRLTKETFGLKKEISYLKESRSKWAKQSSENAEALDAKDAALNEALAEVERLSKREHIEGCYEVYGDCTCKEIYESMKKKDVNNLPVHLRMDGEKVLKMAKENQSLKSELSTLREALEITLELIKARTAHLIDLDNVSKDIYGLATKAIAPLREGKDKQLNNNNKT